MTAALEEALASARLLIAADDERLARIRAAGLAEAGPLFAPRHRALRALVAALSVPPADDVREALPSSDGALTPDQVMQHAYANAVTRAPGRMTWGEALRHFEMWMREHDARLIAEVRPRGTVTDAEAEWEYGVRHVAVDGWPTDLVRSSLDAARADLETCGMNCHLIRRRSARDAGRWEAFHASCEDGS